MKQAIEESATAAKPGLSKEKDDRSVKGPFLVSQNAEITEYGSQSTCNLNSALIRNAAQLQTPFFFFNIFKCTFNL
jgi:hypothetical protein